MMMNQDEINAWKNIPKVEPQPEGFTAIETCGMMKEAPLFYGYICGVSFAPPAPLEWSEPGRLKMYAMFYYANKRTVWQVPCGELFHILSRWLQDSAQEQLMHDGCTVHKVWIEKKEGEWLVTLP